MTKKQWFGFLAEHCIKKDVAAMVAEDTANWRKGLGKKKASAAVDAAS